MKILLLSIIILILSSCVKTVIVERCVVIAELNICRCHNYNFFKNERIDESYDAPFNHCVEKNVTFSLEDWETKISPALNDLNRRAGKYND